jgi:DNA-binding LacI/PurR family transcriptional regulator
LRGTLVESANEQPRYGYRRLHVLLYSERLRRIRGPINPCDKPRPLQSGMPTIVDVAKAAKVSIAAVSLALSDPKTKRVGSEKRKLILDTARRMGYRPNVLARGLHRLGTRILGLIVPMRDPIFFNLFIAEVLTGIQQCLMERGYHLIIYSHPDGKGRITSNEVIQSKGTDGLIFINTRVCTRRDIRASIRELQGAGVPFVMINGAQDEAGINYVGIDEQQLGVTAAEFFAAQGHSKIGILNGPKASPTSALMLRGFQDGLKRAGLAYRDDWSVFGDYRQDRTREAVRTLLAMNDRPTALFCISDQMAPDVYEEVRAQGARIPDDLAVLGRGDLVYAQYLSPPLTTIRVPMRSIGYEAASILIAQLSARESAPRRVLMQGEIAKRQSA